MGESTAVQYGLGLELNPRNEVQVVSPSARIPSLTLDVDFAA